MAVFPFAGWKRSFFGDLHANGEDAAKFYTESKVVVARHGEATRRPGGRGCRSCSMRCSAEHIALAAPTDSKCRRLRL